MNIPTKTKQAELAIRLLQLGSGYQSIVKLTSKQATDLIMWISQVEEILNAKQ